MQSAAKSCIAAKHLGWRVAFPLGGTGKPPGRKCPKKGEKLQNSPPRSDPREWGKLPQKGGKIPRTHTIFGNSLSFLSLIFLYCQGKTLKLTKDSCPLPNPLKPWKRQRNSTNFKQGKSLLKINQGNPKKTKERKDRVFP